jgi:hypothetical protein
MYNICFSGRISSRPSFSWQPHGQVKTRKQYRVREFEGVSPLSRRCLTVYSVFGIRGKTSAGTHWIIPMNSSLEGGARAHALPGGLYADRSVARSLDRSVARSLDRSVARSLGRSALGRSVARSLGRSVARSLGRSVARSLAQRSPLSRSWGIWAIVGPISRDRYSATWGYRASGVGGFGGKPCSISDSLGVPSNAQKTKDSSCRSECKDSSCRSE